MGNEDGVWVQEDGVRGMEEVWGLRDGIWDIED